MLVGFVDMQATDDLREISLQGVKEQMGGR